MDIVVVSNEGYLQHASVMLASLMANNPHHTFRIFLLTDGITAGSQEMLQGLLSAKGSSLQVIVCKQNGLEGLPIGQWNPMIYYKLFMPQVLPADCHRCLFLDVDMVVCDALDGLIDQYPHAGKVIAACEDMPDCIAYKPRLSLSDDDVCINSGVMVCDMDRWRKKEQEQPIFEFVARVGDRIHNEQDVLSMYFAGEIDVLPIRWNMVNFYYQRVPNIFPKYIGQLDSAKRHPAIVHFCAPIKPWFADCNHPLGSLYRKYLELSPWKATATFKVYETLSPRQRLNKRIRNLLNRLNILRDPGFLKI